MPLLKPSSKAPIFKENLPEIRDYNSLFPFAYDFTLIGDGYYFKDYERKSHYYESLCRAANHSNPYLCQCGPAFIMRLSQMGLDTFRLTNEERKVILGTRT